MVTELQLSVVSFLLALVINYSLVRDYSSIPESILRLQSTDSLWDLPLSLLVKPGEILVLLILSAPKRLISVTAYSLGLVFLIGLTNWHSPFGLYLMVLATFHLTEYITTALTNPQNLSFDSFLVNHSVQYWAAMLVSWLEYISLNFLFPDLKSSLSLVTYTGLLVCLLGEVTRKLAMLHAGRNFNHLVQSHKSRDHKLVTTGIYSLVRHPSYVGWFLWSVGTQVLLVNPVCFLLYGGVSFAFFKERIVVEEYNLISFFGSQYRDYQREVGTGIPGIQGYHGPLMWGEPKQN